MLLARGRNIGFNQLTALTPGMFAGIKPSLTYLSLSKNKITKVGV
jgi:Leucine-rich repeat (LRR) protein